MESKGLAGSTREGERKREREFIFNSESQASVQACLICRYLLQSGSKTPPNNIMEVLSMISGQLHCSLERSLLRADLLEQELSKELQNGRLFRVLAKLGAINERPE